MIDPYITHGRVRIAGFAEVDLPVATFPPIVTRKPRRINVTVPEQLLEELQLSADMEGRSLSSLCCYLLETGMEQRKPPLVTPVQAGRNGVLTTSPARL